MHDGRFMRYHKAGWRTLAMLTDPAVPVRSDGAIGLCQNCQRGMWMAGGYLEMLAKRLYRFGELVDRLEQRFFPSLMALKIGQSCGTATAIPEYAIDRAKSIAEAKNWTILIQRRGSQGLNIIRKRNVSDA